MLQNYFKLALRNLLKNKGFSFINLFGLTVGLAACMLIAIYVSNELSFDRYHTNSERIWRVNRKFFNKDGSMQLNLGHLAPPFAPLLKNEFPDIEEASRTYQYTGTFRSGDTKYIEEQMFFAEPNLMKIFDVPLVSGNAETALAEPLSILLNETSARKYFGEQDPVNQTLKLDGRFTFKVSGVFRDFPYNSHWHPDMLASFSTLNDTTIYGAEGLRTNWGNNSFSTYLLLPNHYPTEKLVAQFPAFLDKVMGSMAKQNGGPPPSQRTSLHLTKLNDIHLRSHLDSEIETNGDIKRVWIFSAIALFVLLIACINYMNLSTARSATRAKEIGIRKVSGALRGELIGQFLSESVLLALVATLLAGGLTGIVLPFINNLLGQQLSVNAAQTGWMLAAVAGLAILTGIAAGAYPAFFMSAMQPLHTLKGSGDRSTGSGGLLRKSLVVSQFAISVALIIATMVVFRQLNFMQEKSLGLNKDQVLTMNFYSQLAPQYDAFRNEMLNNPSVKNMARSTRVPSGRLLDSFGSANVQLESGDSLKPSETDLKFVTVDHRFADTYELAVAAGRFYEQDQGNDRFSSFILNEDAAAKIGWKSPQDAVGKQIKYGGRDARIVGILKDFNFESLHEAIQPMIFYIPSDSVYYNYVSLKIDGSKTTEALSHLKATWERFLPEFPFDYQFLDEQYGQLYEAEQRQGRVFIGFALLAILVACLGLFGLASFVAQQRVKEIGIRKVLGATTGGIVGLLSKDFLILVFIALLIASPLAWWVMNQWLQDFAYRIDIQWWFFAVAGLLAVGIAFFTVSFESVKAALANPVESLRNE